LHVHCDMKYFIIQWYLPHFQWNLSKPIHLGTKFYVQNWQVFSLYRLNQQRFPTIMELYLNLVYTGFAEISYPLHPHLIYLHLTLKIYHFHTFVLTLCPHQLTAETTYLPVGSHSTSVAMKCSVWAITVTSEESTNSRTPFILKSNTRLEWDIMYNNLMWFFSQHIGNNEIFFQFNINYSWKNRDGNGLFCKTIHAYLFSKTTILKFSFILTSIVAEKKTGLTKHKKRFRSIWRQQ